MKPIYFQKQDGKITVGRKRLFKYLGSLEDGEYGASIEEWKQTRTNLQNAFMHVCFDVYGKEMGLSPEEAKFYLKKKYGINKLFRDPETGEQLLYVRETSSYTLDEGKVFIDRILRHMEYDCSIIIRPEIRKQYKIDEITGEMEEI